MLGLLGNEGADKFTASLLTLYGGTDPKVRIIR